MHNHVGYLYFQCIFTLKKHTAVVDSVAISPDSKTIASCGREDFIYLWNLETGEYKTTFAEDEDIYTNLSSVCFSSDGKTLVSGRALGCIEFWDVDTGTCRQFFSSRSSNILISSAARQIISSCHEITSVLDLDKGTVLYEIKHHSDISKAIIHPNGKMLVRGENGGLIKVWNLGSGELEFSMEIDPKEGRYFSALAFNSEGRLLAISQANRDDKDAEDVLKIWNFEKSQLAVNLRSHSKITAAVFSPDGKAIFAGCRNGEIQVWDLGTGLSKALIGHTSAITALAISPNGQRLVSGGYDGMVKIWGHPSALV
jgi:WD40 repeat protein